MISAAESSYWDLYQSNEELKLRRRSVEIAGKLLEDNRARVTAGRMGDLEIYQAEAGLVLRETQSADSTQRVVEASSLLRAFLGENATADGGEVRFDPADAPAETDTTSALPRHADTNLQRHPEYQARAATVRTEEARSRYARNQQLPQVDLKASYGYNGLGGRIGTWYDTAETGDYPSWFLGVELKVPVSLGIKERNEARAARSRLAGAQSSLRAAEIDLANQIGAVARRVTNLRTQVASYRRVIEYHEKVLSAELAALDLGRSDSRRVLQAEQDLTEVRNEAIRQRVDLRRAIIELELLDGSYLEKRGLDIASAQ